MTGTGLESMSSDELDRRIRNGNVLHLPGSVLLGLGLFGLFGQPEPGFLEVLAEPTFTHACLAIGVLIEVHWFLKVFPFIREKERRKDGTGI